MHSDCRPSGRAPVCFPLPIKQAVPVPPAGLFPKAVFDIRAFHPHRIAAEINSTRISANTPAMPTSIAHAANGMRCSCRIVSTHQGNYHQISGQPQHGQRRPNRMVAPNESNHQAHQKQRRQPLRPGGRSLCSTAPWARRRQVSAPERPPESPQKAHFKDFDQVLSKN